jgi:hypothetical protein
LNTHAPAEYGLGLGVLIVPLSREELAAWMCTEFKLLPKLTVFKEAPAINAETSKKVYWPDDRRAFDVLTV